MCVQFKAALAVLIVASAPLHLKADSTIASSAPVSAKEVRKAEAEARTAADHRRLAAWYRAEAQQTQASLSEQEELVQQLSGMADRTKVPNPYSNARAWVRIYRERLDKVTELAASHERMAESLQANTGSNQ